MSPCIGSFGRCDREQQGGGWQARTCRDGPSATAPNKGMEPTRRSARLMPGVRCQVPSEWKGGMPRLKATAVTGTIAFEFPLHGSCSVANVEMEVTNFRLTRDPMKYRVPRAHTTCSRLQRTAEPI